MTSTRLWLIAMATFTAAAAGCGDSTVGNGPGPCEGDNPPPSCTVACTDGSECDPGYYCGSAGTCTADCTQGGDECAPGQVCSDDGHCVPGSTNPDAGDPNAPDADCPNLHVVPTGVTPTVYFLIDRSGSMDADFGNTTRFDGVNFALVDPQQGVVTALQDVVFFGAALYDNDQAGVCPDLVPTSVSASLNNRDTIDALTSAPNGPRGDTPTGESLQLLLSAIQADPPPPDSPAIIILATDGEPDTCDNPDPQSDQEIAAARQVSIDGATAAHDAGIDLYILSVGDQVGLGHLQDMANAGVGLPVGGPTNAPFFVANDPTQLTQQLSGLVNGQRGCEFDIDGTVVVDQACDGIVTLDGTPLVCGTDWQMADENTLVLLGDACETFLSSGSPELDAEFPCGVIIP